MSDRRSTADREGLHLRIGFASRIETPTLAGVSASLYDFNILYELGVLLSDSSYAGLTFSPISFWGRNGRRIRPEHRLRVKELRQESPLELAIVIPAGIAAAGGGLWAFWQLIERVLDRRLNRAILEAKLTETLAGARKMQAEADAAEVIAAREYLSLDESPAGSALFEELPVAAYRDRVVRRLQRGEHTPDSIELNGTRIDEAGP